MQDHRYCLALVFLILTAHRRVRGKEALKMVMQLSSRISLIVLLICICVGSVFAMGAFDPSTLEIFEANAEIDDLTEFDEDFLFETLASAAIPYLVFSKSRQEYLDFQAACIKPVSPPPKPI